MPSIYNFCRKELKDVLVKAGFEAYRSDQVFQLIYKTKTQIQDSQYTYKYLPKALKEFLGTELVDEIIGTIQKESVSRIDRTRKLLIELDGPKHKVESKISSYLELN